MSYILLGVAFCTDAEDAPPNELILQSTKPLGSFRETRIEGQVHIYVTFPIKDTPLQKNHEFYSTHNISILEAMRFAFSYASPAQNHIKTTKPQVYSSALTALSIPAKSALGFAPTISWTFSSFLKIRKVGMARMPSSCATSGTSSTSSLMKWALGKSSENLIPCR